MHGAAAGFGHEYREKPVLTAGEVAKLEAEYGVTLPEELSAFLQTVHSGGAGPGYGFELWGNPKKTARAFAYTVADFDALVERKKTDRWAYLEPTDDDDAQNDPALGRGFLYLSHQGCGVFDVLIVTGELRGSIWAYDNAWYVCTHGATLPTFLDWYEGWLDQNLRSDAPWRR